MRSDRFREELSQPKVKEVFDRYKACLRQVFRYYAAGGQNPKKREKHQKGDATMDLGEFNLMVKVREASMALFVISLGLFISRIAIGLILHFPSKT